MNIAIVEDENAAAALLTEYLQRYGEEMGETFEIIRYPDAQAFLEPYDHAHQIVFMDIQMPGMDGMEASRRLREIDPHVVLIFVTNLAQYAIYGYEVGALDFILKPVNYFSLKLKIGKAVAAAKARLNTQFVVRNDEGNWYLKASEIYYVEVMKHDLLYHTTKGKIETAGSLKQEEKRLGDLGFFRCNYCYLVNLHYVSSVRGNMVTVGGNALEVSRNRKKDFLKRLSEFYGERGAC